MYAVDLTHNALASQCCNIYSEYCSNAVHSFKNEAHMHTVTYLNIVNIVMSTIGPIGPLDCLILKGHHEEVHTVKPEPLHSMNLWWVLETSC